MKSFKRGKNAGLALFIFVMACSGGGGSSGGGGGGGGGPTTYSISGTVSGAVQAGVKITLSGAGSAATTTNASGIYSFTGLANGSYTVTPSLAGYKFSPTSQTMPGGANFTGINFTATAVYSISGTVSGGVQAGVTMTLTGAANRTCQTDASGNYSFTGLVNGSYTVTPSLAGYTFSPTSTPVTVSGANVSSKLYGDLQHFRHSERRS